jgi:hypothetical protein
MATIKCSGHKCPLCELVYNRRQALVKFRKIYDKTISAKLITSWTSSDGIAFWMYAGALLRQSTGK